MLKDLIGIQGPRDIQVRDKSVLEKLLEVEDRVVKEYVRRVSNYWKENHNNVYLPLHASLSSELPPYTEQDLQALLLAKENNGYNGNEAQVLGIYTGVLLHVLTERCEQEEKSTTFTFDLNENEFHYLFYFAKRAGEVTVRRVKGNYTCSAMGSYGGQVEKLVIEQNTGNNAAGWAGGDKGTIGTLLINHNTGNYAAGGAGSFRGTIGTLLINQNTGNDAAGWAGSDGGTIGTLAFYEAGRNAGEDVKADRIVTGEEALELYERLMGEMKCLKT